MLNAIMQKLGDLKNIGDAIRFCIRDTYQRIVEGKDISEMIKEIREDLEKKDLTEIELKRIKSLLSQYYELKHKIDILKKEEKERGERLAEIQDQFEKYDLKNELKKIIELAKDYYDTFKEETAKQILDGFQKIAKKQEELEIAERIRIQRAMRKTQKP